MSLDRENMLGIARHERDALGRTIQYTPPDRWESESPAPGWRNRDVVAHLAGSEVAAAAVLGGEAPAELEEYLKSETRGDITIQGFDDFSVARRRELPFRQVVMEWGRAADLFLTRASAVPPEEWNTKHVPWVAGEMPFSYLMQARISEWWMHGNDIREGAGLELRIEHWPIYAVNDLAIRSLPWALGLAGLRYHGKSVKVDLEGTGEGSWHYGLGPGEKPAPEHRPDAWITGRGHHFAQVAARRVPAELAVEEGTLLIGADEALALTILQHIRTPG